MEELAKWFMGLVTAKILTQELNLHRNTITRWRKEGMPYVKVGDRYYYCPKAIKEWLLDRRN